jgi:hypothetical protein
LIGSASGTAKASPATIELKRGEGNMNGLGGVRTSGRFDFRAETGNLVVTARNNQAIRLEIQNILFRSYKSRSFLTNTYVYEFSIDYKVATTTLAAAPDRGKLLLTVRLLKLGATEYEGVYKARFVPSV